MKCKNATNENISLKSTMEQQERVVYCARFHADWSTHKCALFTPICAADRCGVLC